MRLLVHLVGAWVAAEAASGRYPRPISLALGALVSRLGPPTALMALAGYTIQRLYEGGAFDAYRLRPVQRARPRASRRR
ncbi:hypothetical protein [Bosea sp. (in: a-proteobacteria)]|uniref:hypothetical protein n=1 Tax=Bosea sp. (in: a-proteobacteria) TaxID=1871050 RepID=UPI002FC8E8FC